MKTKYLALILTLILALIIVNELKAQPSPALAGPASVGAQTTVPPAEANAQTAPAVMTSTTKFDPASLNKAGTRNQHTAAPSVKSRPRTVYGETDPTSTEPAVYIVQLQDAPLATYQGGVANLAATSPKARGETQLNLRSSASSAYRSYLAGKQDEFKRAAANTLGHALEVIYHYEVTFNGLAIKVTPQEAAKLLGVNGVASIQRDQWRYPMTNDSPTFLGVPSVWNGSGTGGLGGTKGEGVIVGVIDTGIWPEHPSFKDDGSFPDPPADWGGECTSPLDGSLSYTCNNKLIGVQYFLDGYAAGGGYDGLFFSGRDDDGHGTHTASTAAGNENVPVALYGINRGTISGMAPRAHVSAYKGLGPLGGVTSDLVAAIDKAVADGVDVINYSVGSGFAGDPWVDADSLAYLAAREAGVFVATSAGNDGPGVSTVGSPANAPWLTTVGASYFNRLFLSDITLTGPGSPPTGIFGTTATPGVTDFNLVDAEGIPDSVGDDSGNCDNPFLPGTFQATDAVICPRSGIGTWVKGNFVNAGGAGAVVIYNNEDNFDLMAYLHAIPAVYIFREDGLALKQYLANNPGQVQISFTQGERVLAPDPRIPTDTVVGFSSRGPDINESTNQLINVIKPDITAPGLNILAGASPQHITVGGGYVGNFGKQGELFQLIQGTSMSSPHMAGLAALVKALHPNWTPAQMQSALMTTALSQNQQARVDEQTIVPATPFDLGSGRVVITGAVKAGFVLDESVTDYLAVDPFFGGDPSTLNLPSLTQAECVNSCAWTRTLSSTKNSAVTWDVSVTGPAAGNLTVSPATNFNLPAGGTQVISVTATAGALPFDQWAFAEIRFTPSDATIPPAHFPIAIRPAAGTVPLAAVEIETRRNQGRYTISGVRSVATNDLTAVAYLGEPDFTSASLAEDPTNDDPYDGLGDIFFTLVNVPANTKRFVAEIVASTAPDLDLYVGLDTNGNDQPDPDEELCVSASGSWEEICNFPPAGETLAAGDYWVLVQNWAGSGAPEDDFILSTVVIGAGDTGPELTVTGPASVATNVPFNLQVNWTFPDLQAGDNKYGLIEVGTDPGNPANIAVMPLTLVRLEDDVTKSVNVTEFAAPGETVTYTLTIRPEPVQGASQVNYTITDTLPAGLAYVPGSATGSPTVNGNQLIWSVQTGGGRYAMTTNQDDPLCDTGFDGYIDLESLAGILARPDISGNTVTFNFDDFYGGTTPVAFFGQAYPDGLYFTDNGFASLDSPPVNSGTNVDIPNPADPNNLVAPFWRDLAIVYNAATNRGVSVAGIGEELMLVEYDDVEPAPAGSTSNRYDFEIVMLRAVDDTPGAYEIVFAYDNLNGPTTPGTIGLENEAGTQGVKYAHNNAQLQDGLIICFNYTTELELTYQATVDATLSQDTVLTNTVNHVIDAPGYGLAQTSLGLPVAGVIFDIELDGPSAVRAGPITYTLTITNRGPELAANTVVTNALPAGTTHLSGGTLSNGLVTWNIGNLAAHSSTSVQLVVTPTKIVALPTAPSIPAITRPDPMPSIIGGIEAKPGAWPWQVALMFAGEPNGYFAQYCAGSLITPDWVMTAAHCVFNLVGPGVAPVSAINVAVGRHILSSNEGQRLPVAQILVHPDYDGLNDPPDSDVALIRLATPATLTDTVAPISLVGLGLESDLDAPDTFAIVTGWGDRTNGLGNYADALHQVTVPIVSNQTCRDAYDPVGFGPITDNILCAGFAEGGKDACYGDSGGPLVVRAGQGWKVAGIVSSGLECAQPNFYGTYTRVSRFTNWLEAGVNTYLNDDYYVTDSSGQPGHTAFGDRPVTTVVGLFRKNYLPVLAK